MSLTLCGLNYKTAPVELRENFVFSKETLTKVLSDFIKQPGVNEAVVLSTCHRTEWYWHGEPTTDAEALARCLSFMKDKQSANMMPYMYVHRDKQTVSHVFRVAGGLNSMVLGEPQIFGQLKSAVNVAEKTGTLGFHLRRLFERAFFVGKQVRTDTHISANSDSLGQRILHLSKQIFTDLSHCRVLLVGAGETITPVAKHLYNRGLRKLCIANRTLSRANALASLVDAKVIALSELPAQLTYADIIITAIQNDLPLIGKGMVERALRNRKHRPLLMFDLAMPRNVEPEIKQLDDVYLYFLECLNLTSEENLRKQQAAIMDAEAIIEGQTTHFLASLQAHKATHAIRQYREEIGALRDTLLTKAYQELASGDNPQEVLQRFSHRLTNQFLHKPCVGLRKAAYKGEWDMVSALEKLFAFQKENKTL